MNILLTGASGFIGTHLLHALLQNNHHIIACSHSKSIKPEAKIQSIQTDFTKMQTIEDWLPHLKNIDVVINSVGIIAESGKQTFEKLHYRSPSALFLACEQAGVERVIQISALGADDAAIVPYQKSKKQADDVLRKMDLDWFILRPSLVYGSGGKSFALFKKLSNLPIIPLIDNGKQMIQPVHISDLIATVLRCLEDDVPPKQTINVVGKQAISYKNWMISIRTRQSKPCFLSLPFSLIIKLSRLGKYLQLPLLNPDSLRMLQQNNIAASRALTAFLGREPLAVGENT